MIDTIAHPSISGSTVGFLGQVSGRDGIYTVKDGVMSLVAAVGVTPYPGAGGGTFESTPTFSISGDATVLYGTQGLGQGRGVFSDITGILEVVADNSTAIPGGIGTFTGASSFPAISGNGVAFYSRGNDDQEGIYSTIGGTLNVLADKTTALPDGTGNFRRFEEVSMSGNNVVFRAFGPELSGFPGEGIYLSDAGTLRSIVQIGDPIPDGSANTFVGFFWPAISGDSLAFGGQSSQGGGNRGVYAYIGGELSVIADCDTPIPGGSGRFGFFRPQVVISGETIAFSGSDEATLSRFGIYWYRNGVISKVIGPDDMLAGRTVKEFRFGAKWLDADSVVFRAEFSDGFSGVYKATLTDDSDGDGIPDNEDACPDSIGVGGTVIIGECDSGVTNVLFADGCTMADLIQAVSDASADGKEFVAGTRRLTKAWKSQAFISGKEAAQINRCARRGSAGA